MGGDFIFTLVLFASGYVWWRVAVKLRDKQQVLAYRPRTQSGKLFLLGPIILIGWVVFPAVAMHVLNVPEQIGLRHIQATCLANGLLLLLSYNLILSYDCTLLKIFGIAASGWRQPLAEGAIGFLAALLPVFAMQGLTFLIGLRTAEDPKQHQMLQFLQEQPGMATFVWLLISVVILAPLAEELVFRVIVQGWLATRLPPAGAIVTTAVLFSAVHDWPDALSLFPLALILGYVYHRSNSYWAVVVLHLLFNATNLAVASFAESHEAAATVSAFCR
jgi:hypothetical protein